MQRDRSRCRQAYALPPGMKRSGMNSRVPRRSVEEPHRCAAKESVARSDVTLGRFPIAGDSGEGTPATVGTRRWDQREKTCLHSTSPSSFHRPTTVRVARSPMLSRPRRSRTSRRRRQYVTAPFCNCSWRPPVSIWSRIPPDACLLSCHGPSFDGSNEPDDGDRAPCRTRNRFVSFLLSGI